MADEVEDGPDEGGRMDRVSQSPVRTASYYLKIEQQIEGVIDRIGAFDKSVSRLPRFLFAMGLAIFGVGVVLFTYEPGFESAEFQGFVLFAMVLVVASAGVYIAEIRLREGIGRDKRVLSEAQDALSEIAKGALPPAPPEEIHPEDSDPTS